MARRVEFTVSDGQWQALEVARGELPRAAFIKGRLFGPPDPEPPVVDVHDVRADSVEGLPSTVPSREKSSEQLDREYYERRKVT